jgi:hypothetical protein
LRFVGHFGERDGRYFSNVFEEEYVPLAVKEKNFVLDGLVIINMPGRYNVEHRSGQAYDEISWLNANITLIK